MNICYEPKFSVNSKDKIINGKRRNSSKSYNLLNLVSESSMRQSIHPKRLANILKKKLNQRIIPMQCKKLCSILLQMK